MSVPTLSPTALPVTEFAEILFTTTLQESERPALRLVRAEVRRCLDAHGGNCAARAAACIAQEAGDHPEQTARRMRWALRMAHDVLDTAALPVAC